MKQLILRLTSFIVSYFIFFFALAEWRSGYYLDDFGDIMYDYPYVETHLNGINTSFKLCIRYTTNPIPAFELILVNGNHMVTASGAFHTTAISVKDINGTVTKFEIPPESVVNGRIYLTLVDDMMQFVKLIDRGNCKIIVRTETYLDTANNPGNYLFNAPYETKGIYETVINSIYEFVGEDNIVTDEDYVANKMTNFKGSYTLKGKINGKYAVTMNLNFDGGTVNGTYYYDKYKRVMKIDGLIADEGPMYLTEYDGNKETGAYSGLFDGREFQGDFINFATGKKMTFSLIVQ